MKPSRPVRRLLLAGVTLTAGTLSLLAIGRWYARNELISQLAEINGAPVIVETVDFGFRRQLVRGIQMQQAGAQNAPWLTVDRVELELSLWEALQGRTIPKGIVVSDVSMLLQFDQDGLLLTQLPAWLDGGELEASAMCADLLNAQIEIQQPGRDSLTVEAIDIRIRPVDDQLQVAVSVGDFLGSKWLLSCTSDPQSKQASWKASTDLLRVDTQTVEKLPLVPASVSSEVVFAVATPVEATGVYDPNREFQYRLRLAPSVIDVVAQELALTDGRGDIVIENGSVTVSNLNARTLGGDVHVDGSLDFSVRRQGSLAARIEGVELRRLPKSWALPEEVAGVFSGSGEFDIAIGDVGTSIQGKGAGRIADASILGLPVEPIDIRVVVEPVTNSHKDAEAAPTHSGQVHLELAMNEVPLAETLKRFDATSVKKIGGLDGRLSFQGWLRAPLRSTVDLADLEAGGALLLGGVKVGGNQVRELRSDFAVSKGKLELERVRAVIGGEGEIQGNAAVDLSAVSPVVSADAHFARLPVELLSELFPAEYAVSGTVSGRAEATVPVKGWSDLRTWLIKGVAESQQLDVAKWSLTGATTRFQLKEGKLSLTDAQAQWLGSSLEGSMSLDVADGFPFDSQFVANEVPIDAAIKSVGRELPISLTGSLSVRGGVQGTLSPFTWKASGAASLPLLTTGDWQIDAAEGEWKANATALTLARGGANFLGGRVDVTGTVPLDDTGVRLRGTFRQIAPTLLVQKIAPNFEAGVALSGFISGEFAATDVEKPEMAAGEIRFAGLNAKLRGAVVEDVAGQASYRDSMFSAEVEGKALGGAVAFRGQGRIPDNESWKYSRVKGQLTFRNANLSRVAAAFKGQPVRSVQGSAGGELDVEINGPQFQPEGAGRLVLENVKWDSAELTKRATSDVLLSKALLRFENVSASVARGSVSGTVSLNLAQPDAGTFRLDADRLALNELPAAWRSSLGRIRGRLAASVSGRLGRPWRGTGQLRLANATVAGIPIQSLRAPIDWAYSPRSGGVQSKIRFTSARVARGRINGELNARWTRRLDMEGKIKFVNVDMRTLARATPGVNDRLSGRTSGQVQFKGTNVKSFDNLSGTYSAEFTQSQALLIPVLEDLTSSLGFSSPASATFSKTEAKGRFRRGTVKVERMTMESAAAQLFIDGEMNTRGQLDFNVTADTAQAAALGVALGVLRPTEFLRRRLIFLHVGGSLRSPVVQPRVAEFIEQEIILFFLPFGTPL